MTDTGRSQTIPSSVDVPVEGFPHISVWHNSGQNTVISVKADRIHLPRIPYGAEWAVTPHPDLARLLFASAQEANRNIRAAFPDRFSNGIGDASALKVGEEAGEFLGAYNRWRGYARRSGTAAEMDVELADVVISAFTFAAEFGRDLPGAIRAKLAEVFGRGWREPQDGSI